MATVQVYDSYESLDGREWDELVGDASPFLESAFLFGLEATGCAVRRTGWVPRPVVVRDGTGRMVAAAPAWLKTHSMGEFVYDHGWARAVQQAGIPYYPKLVVGVPFTPVTGDRLLVRQGEDRERWLPELLAGLNEAGRKAAGIHVLFDGEGEARQLEAHGAFSRVQFQFHWHNDGFEHYDGFLSTLRSPARKKLRRERREVSSLDIARVVAPDPAQMDHLFRFYSATCTKYVWGQQYLNRRFFQHLAEHWGHRVLGVLVSDGDEVFAGAFDVFKGDRLYGRYWGCDREVKFLHFEVCYHQGIEFAIERGLKVFEPGHGGSHKYRRGFLPEITWSSHWFADERLSVAFADLCRREAHEVRAHVAYLEQQAPFK